MKLPLWYTPALGFSGMLVVFSWLFLATRKDQLRELAEGKPKP